MSSFKQKKIIKKNKTVKELNIEFELLSERVKNLENEGSTTFISKDKVESIEEIIKQYDDKIKHLDQLLNVAKKRETIDECESISGFKCNECGNCFERKPDLTLSYPASENSSQHRGGGYNSPPL